MERASVAFCEDYFETYNTISSLAFCVAGWALLPDSIGWVGVSVGVGSMLLHATQTKYGQWADELSMLWFINHDRWIESKFIMTVLYLMFSRIYFVFLGMFIYGCVTKLTTNRYRIAAAVAIEIGFIAWLLDMGFCRVLAPYRLHAMWHILAAVSMYLYGVSLKDISN